MPENNIEVLYSGFQTFKQDIGNGAATVYTDNNLNVELLVTTLNNGKIKIQPKNCNACIEISSNQVIITPNK